MVLDTRIALAGQGLDVGQSLAKGYQLRDFAAQADARRLDTQLRQQEQQKMMTLGDLHKQHTRNGQLDRAAFAQAATDAGYGLDVPDMQKRWNETDLAQEKLRSLKSDRVMKAIDYTSKSIASMLNNPNATAADAARMISNLVNMGIVDQAQGAMLVQEIPTDPHQFRQYMEAKLAQNLQAKDLLMAQTPKIEAVNLGGDVAFVDTNNRTSPGVAGGILPRTATPGELETMRHNRAMEVAQAARAQKDDVQIVPGVNGEVLRVNKQTGQATPVTGADGQKVFGKGSVPEQAYQAAKKGEKDIKNALAALDAAEKLLEKLNYFEAGPLIGKHIGFSKAAQEFDALTQSITPLLRGMMRTPGEGAVSDYESKLYNAALPTRENDHEIIKKKFGALRTLLNDTDKLYKETIARADAKRGGTQPAQPAAAQEVIWEGERDGRKFVIYGDNTAEFVD